MQNAHTSARMTPIVHEFYLETLTKLKKKLLLFTFYFFQPNRNVISVLLLTILDGNKKCPVFKFILVTGGTKVENYPIFQFLVCLFLQCSSFLP